MFNRLSKHVESVSKNEVKTKFDEKYKYLKYSSLH